MAAKKKPAKQPAGYRNRVVERRRMLPSELLDHPLNWKDHPPEQLAPLVGLLGEVGQVGELYAYPSERNGGKLTLVNGHARKNLDPNQPWDVAICDLTDAEADKVLALYDPLAALAATNAAKHAQLLLEIETESEELERLIADLAGEEAEGVELRPVETDRPPVMTWVLIGIPTVRFGEINADVERLAALPGVVCETTANNG